MSKYLVIDFNRYDTDQSTHQQVEADSPLLAIIDSLTFRDEEERADAFSFYSGMIVHTDEIFSSVGGEENDVLVYLIS